MLCKCMGQVRILQIDFVRLGKDFVAGLPASDQINKPALIKAFEIVIDFGPGYFGVRREFQDIYLGGRINCKESKQLFQFADLTRVYVSGLR